MSHVTGTFLSFVLFPQKKLTIETLVRLKISSFFYFWFGDVGDMDMNRNIMDGWDLLYL